MANIFDYIKDDLKEKKNATQPKKEEPKTDTLSKIGNAIKDVFFKEPTQTSLKGAIQESLATVGNKVDTSKVDVNEALGGAYNTVKNNVQNAQKTLDFISSVSNATNKIRRDSGIQSPLVGATQNVINPVVQTADRGIGTLVNKAHDSLLDYDFGKKIDTTEIKAKMSLDNDYKTRIATDYTEEIERLNNAISNSTNSVEKSDLKAQLKEIESIQNDQSKLVYENMYNDLVEKGATDEELRQFKNAVVSNDTSLMDRIVGTVGGTLENFAGSLANSAEALYQKAAQIVGTDFDSNDPNSIGNALIDNSEQIMMNASQGVEGVEKVIQDSYKGMSSYMYSLALAYATGGGNFLSEEAAEALNGRALLISDASVLGQTVKQKQAEGYSFDQSLYNSMFHAALSHTTESIGGEALVNIVTTPLGNVATRNLVAYTIKSLVESFGAEAVEEGMEALAEPIIEDMTLNTGLTVEQYCSEVFNGDTAYQMFIGGLGGVTSGTLGSIYNIARSKKGYNQLSSMRDTYNDLLFNGELTNEEKVAVTQEVSNINNMLAEIKEQNPYMDAFTSASDTDVKTLSAKEVSDTIAKGSQIDMVENASSLTQLKEQMLQKNTEMFDKLGESLREQGIEMDAVEFTNLSAEAKLNASVTAKYSKSLGRSVMFADLKTKSGETIDGAFVNGRIVVNPNAKLGALSTMVHEYTHGIEKTKYYKQLKNSVRNFFGENYESAVNNIIDEYSDIQNLSFEEAEAELVAITTQSLLDNDEYVDRLVNYQNSLASRMYEDIKHLGNFTDVGKSIEYNFMRAFNELEAMKTNNDADFSYVKNADIMKAQQEWYKNLAGKKSMNQKGAKFVTQAELDLAQSQMNTMADLLSENSDLLPKETIANVLLKDAAYGLTVENSTKCPRTLAYDELTNLVSDKVGRPLTAIESFLVSQKLYQIAVDPQCLYCYVALDRKSYNEFVGKYVQQRDEALNVYKEKGSPKLVIDEELYTNYLKANEKGNGLTKAQRTSYKDKFVKQFTDDNETYREFLSGRKSTPNMVERYKGWIDALNRGDKLLTEYDVRTDQSRDEIFNNGGTGWNQLKDMLDYAQAASWAKKSYEYRAYFDDIRKLSQSKVNELNKHYGLRWYSFNDYTPAYILENMQQFTDASLKGLKGLAYTKDTDFARIFAPTGANINISVYASKDANGNFRIDPLQSADIQEAIELRKQYPNVGIVVTSTSAEGVKWALDQEWSDVVIPFHIVRTGDDIAKYYQWTVFNQEQNDTIDNKLTWQQYVESLNKPEKKISKMVLPHEHQNNLETYLKLCSERGLKPRFSSFLYNENGSYNPNYMKLVNETRQSDGQTNTLKPSFDMNAAQESFAKFQNKGGFYGGWYKDNVDLQTESNEVANDILAIAQGDKQYQDINYGEGYVDFDEYLLMKKNKNKVAKVHGKGNASFSLGIRADSLGNKLSPQQRSYFKDSKVVDDNGRLKVMYHGTNNAGFTTFNRTESGGYFFTDNKDVAKGYALGTNDVFNPNAKYSAKELVDLFDNATGGDYEFNPNDLTMTDWDGETTQFNSTDEAFAWLVDNYYSMGASQNMGAAANYEVYLDVKNPYIVDANGENFDHIETENGFVTTDDVVKYAKENGYDGVFINNVMDNTLASDTDITNNEVIVFNPEQIKSIGNEDPTSNTDIRYSKGIALDSLGTELSDGQKEYFKDSKMVDKNGKLKVMYHGTDSANFTIFDPQKSDDNISLFFTDSKEMAKSYYESGERIIDGYDIEKEYSIDELKKKMADISSKEKYVNYGVKEDNGEFIIYDIDDEDNVIGKGSTPTEAYKKYLEYDSYWNETDVNSATYEVYLNATNPMVVDADGDWDKIRIPKEMYEKNSDIYSYDDYVTTRELAEFAKNNGYDSLIVNGVMDWGNYVDETTQKTKNQIAVVFDSNQVKSVNNLNPTDSKDIRYSKGVNLKRLMDNYDVATEEELYRTLDLNTETEKALFRDIHKFTRKFKRDASYPSTLDAIKEVAADLNDVGFVYPETEQALFDSIYDHIKVNEKIDYGYSKTKLRERMREMSVSWDQIKDDYGGSYEEFKSDYPFVNALKTKDGKYDWDQIKPELAYEFGDIFSENEFGSPTDFFNDVKRLLEVPHTVDTKEEVSGYIRDELNKIINNIETESVQAVAYDETNGTLSKKNLERIEEKEGKQRAFEMLGIDDEAYWNYVESTADLQKNIVDGNTVKDSLSKISDEKAPRQREPHTIRQDAYAAIKHLANKSKYLWDLSRQAKDDTLYAKYNQTKNARGMAEHMLYKKGGWMEIYDEIHKMPSKDQKRFADMVYHGVNIDAAKYGKNVFADFSSEESQIEVDKYLKGHPEWKQLWKRVVDYNTELRRILVEYGRISQTTADQWEAMYPNYVRVLRDFDADTEIDDKIIATNSGAVKSRTGGGQNIKSLHEAMLYQTNAVMKAATMNDFANEYVKVANPKVSNDFADIGGISEVLTGVGNELSAPTKDTPATLVYYTDGEMKLMEVPNELYEIFAYDNKMPDSKINRALTSINNFRRNIITGWNPLFTVSNIIKDSQDVMFKSEHPLSTMANMPKAMIALAMKDNNSDMGKLVKTWKSMGGGSGNLTELHNGSKFYNSTIGLIERVNDYVESVPRFAEFMASLDKGRTLTQAMYDSDKVTTNFKMGGDWTKFADRNGATFLNASVEGFNEIIQSYETAYDKKGWKGVVGKMAYSTLVAGIPLAIINGLVWKDDKDYEELNDYIKDNYYIVYKLDDGRFFRIPKGRIAAAYQGVINSLWDSGEELISKDDPLTKAKVVMWENSLDAINTAWDNIGVNNPITNNIVAPVLQVAWNKTWYGDELLSEYELEKDNRDQYDYTTDKLSRFIGGKLDYSPKKINYLLDQYSGGIGDVVLPMLTPKAETDINDGTIGGTLKSMALSPAIDKFVTDPVFKNQKVTDIFDLNNELKKAASKESASDEEKIASLYISTITKEMNKLYGERKDVFNEDTPDTEKYPKARGVQQKIVELAKFGLDSYDQIDMSGDYAEIGGYSFRKTDDEWKKVKTEVSEEMKSLGMGTKEKESFLNVKDGINADGIKKEEAVGIISNSSLTFEHKNYVYDKKYSSKLNDNINDMDISDEQKFKLKTEVSTTKADKDENGKTIANSKANKVADEYREAGVLDEVVELIKEDPDIDPSDMGLSKTVFNEITGQTTTKAKTSSSRSGGGSGGSANKLLSAMTSYYKELAPTNNVFDIMKSSTSVKDAIEKSKKIRNKYAKKR